MVHKMTAPLVKENGILSEGRAQFITLHLPDNSSLTIINIYAPRSSRDRAPLWRRVSDAEFVADHLIMGGDFNHLEEVNNRGLVVERWMHRRETASWHHMTLQYGLEDVWTMDSYRKMSKKDYTFNNERSGPGSIVSRIDKLFVSQELDSRGGRIEVAPSIRKMIDHSPWS
jgi:exonuclease III